MRTLMLSAVIAAALAGGAAHAAPATPLQPQIWLGGDPIGQTPPREAVQFFFGGQNYCWYYNGWRGPGYYWCGYAGRRGQGWGGGRGWNGWTGHGAGGHRGGDHGGGGRGFAGGGHVGGRHADADHAGGGRTGGGHMGGGAGAHMGGGHGGGGEGRGVGGGGHRPGR